MTVIAWDGETLAADKRMGFNGEFATVTKIHRIDGSLVGWAGDAALGRAMIEWWSIGRDPNTFPAAQRGAETQGALLVVSKYREIYHFGNEPFPMEIEDKTYTIGSGSPFASAAMYCGRNARQAVEVAIALDMHCGNGIDTLTLKERP